MISFSMDRNIHTDALFYRTTVLSERLKLSEDTVERVVDIQKRYQRQGFCVRCPSFEVCREDKV